LADRIRFNEICHRIISRSNKGWKFFEEEIKEKLKELHKSHICQCILGNNGLGVAYDQNELN
jgi:hypothetical protein